jgi:hypothetical protein
MEEDGCHSTVEQQDEASCCYSRHPLLMNLDAPGACGTGCCYTPFVLSAVYNMCIPRTRALQSGTMLIHCWSDVGKKS